jgi:hypothetical protein
MNLPTLWEMQVAVEECNDQWDVFINLAGDNLLSILQIPWLFNWSSSRTTL